MGGATGPRRPSGCGHWGVVGIVWVCLVRGRQFVRSSVSGTLRLTGSGFEVVMSGTR